MRKNFLPPFIWVSIVAVIYVSCSKGGDSGGGGYTNPPPNPCTGVTISVSANVTGANAGQSNGSITAAATGGAGFTYKLGTGAYQSSGTFNNLAPGSYTITAKNSNGCEGSASFTVATINACNGVAITVSNTATTATPCGAPNGTITVTAAGSSGLTYSINGTSFQSSNVFNSLSPGNYTVTVKDANGCTQAATTTLGATAAGPLFTAVRQLIQNNCVSCHSGPTPAAGRDWSVDCNVVANSAAIKTRAVDQAGTATQMPQVPNAALSVEDRQKITAWINAGGNYSN
jgi:uncharacterized protein (DUF2141 family)